MDKQIHVAIGIQARSTSSRLPNKISQMIGRKMVIDHVIDSCKNCAEYVNRYSFTNHITCSVFVLIPHDDPIKRSLLLDSDYIIEGSETDVLARYVEMAEIDHASHIVRITSDCPLIPPFLIYKCINSAIRNGFDYFSNVGDLDQEIRTSIDGHDVEVLSIKALDWLSNNAISTEDREHVTSALRNNHVPGFLRRGILIGHTDHSDLKLSIDTEADLERARAEYARIERKVELARLKYGKTAVHRY